MWCMYIRIKYVLNNFALPAQFANWCACIVLYRQYMHEVFHSFPPIYQPFESHHLVGSHQLQRVMKVTDMTPLTLCTKACVEPISMHQASRRSSPLHIYVHSHIIYCTCVLVIYTYHYYVQYVTHWSILTACSHNCRRGSRTAAYNMHKTMYCKSILYVYICILYTMYIQNMQPLSIYLLSIYVASCLVGYYE